MSGPRRQRSRVSRPAAAAAATIAVTAVALALVSCGGRTVIERRVIEYPTAPSDSARSWVGHSRETLEKVWGRPSSTAPDGSGGLILTYLGSSAIAVKEGRGGASISTSAGEVEVTSGTEIERKREHGKFWLDRDGRIYRYWMLPALFESGDKDPPGVGPGFESEDDPASD